jgi:hypothetical protein
VADTKTPPSRPDSNAKLLRLFERASTGDETPVPRIRELLKSPEPVGLLGGDLAEQVILAFTRQMAEKNVGFREATRCKLELLRAELLGDNPTPVERVLVERVLACWLQVQDAELRTAQEPNAYIKLADFHQRRMDATNRRFLVAVKTLALVRKLAVPVLQVNIAKEQVNVATNAVVTTGAG